MNHSRLLIRCCAACSLLAVSSATLWLPLRGIAQEGAARSRAAQIPPADGTTNDGAVVSRQNGAVQTSDSQTDDALADDAGPVNSDTNGGDSAIGRNGEAIPNPRVGVDTTGRTSATATRNGRTVRRRPRLPINPVQINDSTQGTGSTSLDPGNQLNRLFFPVPSRQPGDYTLTTDPNAFGTARRAKPLPLFGYDFFQPARQIIVARRRALLPRPAPTSRTTVRSGNNARRQNPTRLSNGNTYAPNNSGGYSSDQTGSDQADMSGDQATEAAGAAALGAAAVSGRRALSSDGSSVDNGNADSADYSAGSLASPPSPRSRQGGMSDLGQDGVNTGTTEGNNADGSNADATSQDSTDMGTVDANGNRLRRRRPSVEAGDTNASSPDAFPGDSAAPGSDIQFPGDDALVSGNAANNPTNAVTGEVADPVAILYRNVLTSLPPNYQLQPGDSVTVRYSALTIAPREFATTVDAQGGIGLPELGRVSVAGRTATQAEDILRQRLERLYRNVDVSVSLRQLRTIQVTVSGAAFAPGTYTVPASATAFNVLNAAGGPTASGSLRDIRVLRNGRLAGTLDIYPLIGATTGNPSARNGDIALQSGDNIYIPERLSRVAIRGEVRQEAIYELTPAETLRDALNYAGGVKPSGVDQNIHIDTVNSGTNRVIVDVNLRNRAEVASTHLYDGDSVEISSVRAILTNRVTVAGAVDQPGDYALTPGMRVLDLIQRARGPLYDAYLDRADLTRLNPDNTTTLISLDIAKALDGDTTQNVPLARFDRLQLYTRPEVAYLGRRQVTVRGAVQRPGLYTQSDHMRVSDLLLDTGGPLPDAYLNRAVLLHQRGDGTYAYDYVNLHDVLSGDDPTQDLPIEDNDILAVYRVGEAHFTPDHTVKILGDVVAPGLYARGEGMRLSDLLKLAGAFKPGGGTRVTVAHARRPVTDPVMQAAPLTVAYDSTGVAPLGVDTVLQDGDVVAVQGNGSLRDHPLVVTVTGAVNRPGPIVVARNMRLSDAVREAGGLRPEAFPQGAEFTRTSDALVTTGQLNLAQVISQMSDMLNLSQYQRERAKANLELIQAAGTAASGTSSSVGIGIPGLSPASNTAASANSAGLFNNLSQNNLVSQGRVLTPSQLQPNGSVAVRLTEALKRPGGTEDFLLKDGDTLVVPETPTTVQVVGAVIRSSGVVFKPGESIDYYIQRAGDFTPDAARDRIEVIHAGGGLIPASKAGAIQPGDLILVPTKVLAEKVEPERQRLQRLLPGAGRLGGHAEGAVQRVRAVASAI